MTTEEIESERAHLQSEVARTFLEFEKAERALIEFEREQSD